MSEVLRSKEFEPAPAVAEVMHNWLDAEIVNSMSGKNAVLDDWEGFKRDVALPFTDSRNQDAGKARSHYNRLKQWTLSAELYPTLVFEDEFIARQIFCAQMFVSGAFRKQCFLEGMSNKNYRELRLWNGPTGIDLKETIQARFDQYRSPNRLPSLGLSTYHDTFWANLQELTLRTNEESFGTAREVHGLARVDINDGLARNGTLELLRRTQKIWTTLAADYMVFAATQRGDGWESVPLLEPKSISEGPRIFYPFAK